MKAGKAPRQRPAQPRMVKNTPAADLEKIGGGPHFMMSLARGLLVLNQFDEKQPRLTIAQASTLTGLTRATVKRCFYTLEKLGYVGSSDGVFSPRPKLSALASGYRVSASLAEIAQPLLNALGEQINESCSLGILDAGELFFVARGETSRIISIALKPGSRLPAYCTSMGRVLLAHLPPSELEAYLKSTALEKRTPYTVTTVPELQKIFASVRRNGYAIVDQELELGLRSAAAPIFSHDGKIIAAISAGLYAARTPLKEVRERIVPAVIATCNEVTKRLG